MTNLKNYTLVSKGPKQPELFGFGGEKLAVLHDCKRWFFGRNLISTLGLTPPKMQAKSKKSLPNPMKSMYPTQIGFVRTVQGRFAKCPAPPLSKNAKEQFHQQNPEKASKTYEIHIPNSDRICSDFAKEIC